MKIKGWKKDAYTGNIMAWVTTEKPFLNVWITQIYGKNGLWEVNINFGVPKTQAFKTKKEALNYAYKIMKKQFNQKQKLAELEREMKECPDC